MTGGVLWWMFLSFFPNLNQTQYQRQRTAIGPTLSGTAGEGNRTLVFSLEGYCSTIELHPHGHVQAACSVGRQATAFLELWTSGAVI